MAFDLKAVRKEKYRFAADVAKKLGVSRQRYSNIENGHYSPTIAQAKQLGALLGFDWWKLFE